MKAEAAAVRYAEELLDLWSSETRAATILPRMARAADGADVAEALRRLAWVTSEQRRRLERLLNEVGETPQRTGPSSGAGVFDRIETTLRQSSRGDARDLVLIGLAQRLAHLSQAGYGIARTLAEKLDYSHHAATLQASLEEDAELDFRLTRLALFEVGVEPRRKGSATRKDGSSEIPAAG